MGVEELKAMVEAVKAVSGDAREVLLWYIGTSIAKDVLWACFWFAILSKVLAIPFRLVWVGSVSKKIAEHIDVDPEIDRGFAANRRIHAWVDGAIKADRKQGLGRGGGS